MNRFTIGKTGLVLALFAIVLSGCVGNYTSAKIVFKNDKPSADEQLYIRYADGTVVNVAKQELETTVTVPLNVNKLTVGGYIESSGIAWVPEYSYDQSDYQDIKLNIDAIGSTKPSKAAHHVEFTEEPKWDTSHQGYISVKLSIYDDQDNLVEGQTEIFLKSDNPDVVFFNNNPRINSGNNTANGGFSGYTTNGYVTFLIKADSPQINQKINLYSGSTLLTDNLFRIVTKINVSNPDDVYSVVTGETLALNATTLPTNAANPNVTWSVSDQTGTATIDSATGVLTAGNPGTVLAQATATDGSGIVGSVQVTITPPPILVNSISISGSDSVQAGQSIPLTANALPADATNPSVVWSVQDGTGKATIDANGKLTGTTAGTVLVKAEAADLSGVFGTKTVLITTINNGGNGGNTGGNSGGGSSGGSGSPTAPAPTPVTPSDPSPQPTPGTDVVPGPTFNSQVLNMDSFTTSFTQKVKAAQSNPATVQLTDTATHWAGSTVTTFVKLGVVTGYTDGSFHPNASITRAEFATLIAKVFDLSSNQGNTISDVSGHWAESSIRSLQSKGVLSGYPDGTFRPNQEIKRSEIIAIISRIMDLSKVTTAEAPAFSDLGQTWNKDQLQQAAAAGIIQGDRNGEFHPANSASRAEALTIILRVLQTNSEFEALLQSL